MKYLNKTKNSTLNLKKETTERFNLAMSVCRKFLVIESNQYFKIPE